MYNSYRYDYISHSCLKYVSYIGGLQSRLILWCKVKIDISPYQLTIKRTKRNVYCKIFTDFFFSGLVQLSLIVCKERFCQFATAFLWLVHDSTFFYKFSFFPSATFLCLVRHFSLVSKVWFFPLPQCLYGLVHLGCRKSIDKRLDKSRGTGIVLQQLYVITYRRRHSIYN